MGNGEPDRRFRAAVLSVVKHAYVPNGVAAHPRFELAVVADDADRPDWVHQRNEQYAAEHGIPYVRDVARALAEFDVDLAVISSEAERHCDLAVRAATSGLHVIVDKPLSTRLSECDRLVAAVESQGVKSLLWNRNFLPALVQARQLVNDGAVGKLHAIHVDFYFAKDAGPPRGARGPDDPPLDWLESLIAAHVDGSDGGVGHQPMGELEIEGIYPLAYIQMLSGAPVEHVFARTAAHFHQRNVDNDVDDLATVTLQLQGGLIGSLCIGRIGASSHPDIGEIKLHLLGSEGALVVSEARPEVAVYYRQQARQEFPHRRVGGENDFLLMEHFAQAIDRDEPTILDVRAGRQIAATVAAALESGRSGRLVAVAPPA
ncbi:MAG: oxidoreductase [Planctomycetaceae bacterium]|nr:oxidoreductase [Planctomycetaceae bacterium]